ncbi:hypothetical protein ACFL2Q_14565 [Thermodesulfobacteriota bacterium]
MKVDEVWYCDVCGLEIKVVKSCTCSDDPSAEHVCPPDSQLMCCGKPLTLKK